MAGQEGFEPPTSGFGVRRSAVRATGLHLKRYKILISFLDVLYVSDKSDNTC